MSTTTETGHAKNVANFDVLISFITSYGTEYNPSKTSIKIPALQSLSADAKTAISEVHAALSANSKAITAREASFEPLGKLVTRVLNALNATDTTPQVDDNARTLVRKIQGKRATPKKTDEEKDALAAEGIIVKEISASQMGHDNRLDNLDKLVKLLESIELYAPNEEDLKISGLTKLLTDLTAKNTAVVASTTHLSNSRVLRNGILYKTDSGVVDIALAVKHYIKSLYGTTSPQYKQVGRLGFKTVNH